MRPQAVERVRFVLSHQATVADHISGKDGGELAFHGLGSGGLAREAKTLNNTLCGGRYAAT
jgi:hypothetical protein